MPDTPTHPDTSTTDETAGAQRETRPRMPRWVKIFGIIALILAVLVVVRLLIGGGHGPGRHFGGRTNTAPTTASQNVGTRADAASATRMVEVTTRDSMAFQPAAITVSAGETVTFTVANAGKSVHEFTLGNAAMQQEHAQAMAHIPAGVTHEFPNSLTLQPGETKSLTWRFGDAGVLEYACHVKGHYEAGMRGRITVG